MSAQVTMAVIGAGHLGGYHCQKMKTLESVNFVGICDPDPEKLQQRCAEYPGVEGVADYRQLLGKVQGVLIASPTFTHHEIAKFFLQNNVHVFVEKPLTETVEQAQELCDLAKKHSCVLQVGHVERFYPALLAAQEKLKQPLFIEGHRIAPFKPRSMDVDVILDLMIHDIDVVLNLMKSEVVSISAVGTPVLTSMVDIASARIEFASNAVANLTASRVSQKSERKFRVFQKDQYLSIDFGTAELNLTSKTGPLVDFEKELPLSFDSWSLDTGDALMAEDKAFVHSILNGQPARVPGEQGLQALEVAEQIRADIARRL